MNKRAFAVGAAVGLSCSMLLGAAMQPDRPTVVDFEVFPRSGGIEPISRPGDSVILTPRFYRIWSDGKVEVAQERIWLDSSGKHRQEARWVETPIMPTGSDWTE